MAAKARLTSVQPGTRQVVLLIAAVALVCYWPSLSGGFVFDDDTLLTNSPLIQGAHGLYRMWFTTTALDYWPLTNSSFWLEWRLWGMHSTGYHMTNLALHITSGVLVWSILRRLAVPGALLAALLFVVHPVNVESVAWIAQRKNTLSMVFFLLSVLWYLRFDEIGAGGRPASAVQPESPNPPRKHPASRARNRQTQPAARSPQPAAGLMWYWLSLAAFVLAMLSKGSVAILPGLLLLIAWFRRGRLGIGDLARTAPFFVVAAGLTLVNIWFQNHYMTGAAIRDVTLTQRLLGAAAIVWFYLYKALLPIGLIFMYPQWTISPADARWWAPLAAGVGATGALWWLRGRPAGRALLAAWIFFCLALVPVMGLTDVYFMKFALVADHYQYIAIIGVVAAVAAGLTVAMRSQSESGRLGLSWPGALLVAVLGVLTWRQASLYADAETLYRATLADNPSSWLVHNDLGVLIAGRSMTEALEHFHESIRLNPNQIEAHNNLCHSTANVGLVQEAVAECTETLRRDPSLPIAHNDLGGALATLGRMDDARREFEAALRLDPNSAEAHNNLANVLAGSHEDAAAIEQYREAIRLQPDFATAHNNLGLALEKQGRVNEAVQEYQEAIRLDPALAQARSRLDALRR